MTTVFDVDANELINSVSKALKKNEKLKPPSWTKYVKTGADKERPPQNPDWWYVRLASLLRNLYLRSPKGVQRMRIKYGSRRKRRYGYAPKKHVKSGGKIIRAGLQMLEKEGLVKKVPKKGRALTSKGRSLLDKTAAIIKTKPKKTVKKKETKGGNK
ncbi:30S ribosomal protein S19e [archaeon]|nr:30S ribosomal protein S19e [archaeon]